MKLFIYPLVVLVLVGIAPVAWAGAVEEIAEVGRLRTLAFSEGNLEAWIGTYADDAVLTSARVPFRIEGKEALRVYYGDLFRAYPTRRAVSQHVSTRVYNRDTTAVTNSYVNVTLVDRNGQTNSLNLRASLTWVKLDGRWLIVDAHGSRLPISP